MRTVTRLTALVALLCVLTVSSATAVDRWPNYSVPVSKLDEALDCASDGSDESGEVQVLPQDEAAVLLVHGTGVNRETNFSWNLFYALRDLGFPVCWVQLPAAALGDMQISAEYVARAIEVMHRQTDASVDVIGHSQGGIIPRWAIKWFSSGKFVDDFIGVAAPNHGTVVADGAIYCFESCWQMKTTSRFNAALNEGDETPRDADYTSIYTASDELVQPVGTQALDGAKNILIQDLCPGRPVDHAAIIGDQVTLDLILQALATPGNRWTPEVDCTSTAMQGGQIDGDAFPPAWEDRFTDEEPPLKPYAR